MRYSRAAVTMTPARSSHILTRHGTGIFCGGRCSGNRVRAEPVPAAVRRTESQLPKRSDDILLAIGLYTDSRENGLKGVISVADFSDEQAGQGKEMVDPPLLVAIFVGWITGANRAGEH